MSDVHLRKPERLENPLKMNNRDLKWLKRWLLGPRGQDEHSHAESDGNPSGEAWRASTRVRN